MMVRRKTRTGCTHRLCHWRIIRVASQFPRPRSHVVFCCRPRPRPRRPSPSSRRCRVQRSPLTLAARSRSGRVGWVRERKREGEVRTSSHLDLIASSSSCRCRGAPSSRCRCCVEVWWRVMPVEGKRGRDVLRVTTSCCRRHSSGCGARVVCRHVSFRHRVVVKVVG